MFLFKKIVSAFLLPLPLCLITCFAGLILIWFTNRQRTGKILITIGIFILALFSFSPISDIFLGPLEYQYESYYKEASQTVSQIGRKSEIKYVVVLGGGHIPDPKIPITSQINPEPLVRLVEGIRICRENPGSRLILSGGGSFPTIPEAKLMADMAEILGIETDRMIIEPASQDTKDQARFIKAIVGQHPFVLVTSAMHMPRSMALFKGQGMNPVPAPVGHLVREDPGLRLRSIFPNADALSGLEKAIHEYLGIIWAKLRGQS